jgi:hypothetical protein
MKPTVQCIRQKSKFPVQNGLKQGAALSSLLFNFALEYAFRWVQEKQDDRGVDGRVASKWFLRGLAGRV